ncbi:pyruvate phosphate dikinase [Candidatus Caldarchaeum subterraneum]|uniref:pyruvate, phosphate dikinase n=1 Tax=Caldiarchaeum subterraneum TaxID=311458 RepID=E6N7L7_CALS0|nr:pyruvate phosphate dikinase [Candidatus Caldarchaeum subterraneum]BAJ49606.1 pyruvate phosphate dikinase [Candidatus Caldarchaeum subterraneum]BAJ51082.1 pyruvate phosphate dikinase [Candidatus Caldarchaeum subterraneum]GBC72208.1 Pyruvate, phosphate dikinase [archaeon HR03]
MSSNGLVGLFEEFKNLGKFELGGKGYGLVQMSAIGLPVPPGIIILTTACKMYYREGGRIPEGLFEELMEKLRILEKKVGKRLGDPSNPLLLSVRSGAPYSMPGMMDTILNLGINDAVAEGLAKLTGDRRFAYDAYRRFIQMFARIAMGVKTDRFEKILEETKQRLGVRFDIEIPAEELRKIVEEFKRIVKEETGRELPQDPSEQLKMAVEAVFKSWNNPRAIEYRKFYKIPDDLGTAVNIQMMVFGNLGENSGTGVGFTRDPSTGEKKLFGEYLPKAQGEDVVAGIRTPYPLSQVEPQLYRQLLEMAEKLEKHFRDMQDFEFTVENGKLYLLQTRNGKRTAQAAVKIAVDMFEEGLITAEEALLRVEPKELNQLLHRRIDASFKGKPIAKGLNASPGAATGKVVFDTDEAAERGNKGEKVILVRPETTPEDIKGIIAAQGVLTSRGGMTSHAAVVARGMGKPAVVGCESIKINMDEQLFVTADGVTVRHDDVITIDGSTGNVYLGEAPTTEPEMTGELNKLLSLADRFRRLGVRANADTPEAAARARSFGAEGIGLCRTERMFNAPERLPIVREMIMAETSEERRRALEKLLPFQVGDFIGIFTAMKGLPVTVRLLDLPLHEFLPPAEEILKEMFELVQKPGNEKEIAARQELLRKVLALKEHNPMLGHRGCRLAIRYPEIYEMQVRAILTAAIEVRRRHGETAKIQIMLPLVSEKNELAYLRKIIEETAEKLFKELGERIDYKVGTMIETPRAALTAAEIAEVADFFSFGTNDLTQTTYGFSRDDAEAKFMADYLEKNIVKHNPFESIDTRGVGRLVEMATAEGKKANPHLEVGICGEHGGDPDSVKFFHKAGLDYVSASPYRVPIARLAAAQAAVGEGVKIAATV